MNPLLELELGTESIDRAEVDLVVAGFFADERPLRGAAGQADWRLCGLISEQLEAERLRGESGEAVLLATFGRLAAPQVLVLGLGERSHFGRDDLRSHTRDAVSRAARLGVRSVALTPLGMSAVQGPGGPDMAASTGLARWPGLSELPELADDVVSAALDALRSAGCVLKIRLLTEVEEAVRVAQAVADVVAGSPESVFEGGGERPGQPPLPAGLPGIPPPGTPL